MPYYTCVGKMVRMLIACVKMVIAQNCGEAINVK
jgi:hypothetical protein